jgi:hypothetical protein
MGLNTALWRGSLLSVDSVHVNVREELLTGPTLYILFPEILLTKE